MDTNDLSHWNHRVIKRSFPRANGNVDVMYGIHEVYYDADGKPVTCTKEAVEVVGENEEALQQTLEWMKLALTKPVLDFDKDF